MFHKLAENKEIIVFFGIKWSNRFKASEISYNPSYCYLSNETLNMWDTINVGFGLVNMMNSYIKTNECFVKVL